MCSGSQERRGGADREALVARASLDSGQVCPGFLFLLKSASIVFGNLSVSGHLIFGILLIVFLYNSVYFHEVGGSASVISHFGNLNLFSFFLDLSS